MKVQLLLAGVVVSLGLAQGAVLNDFRETTGFVVSEGAFRAGTSRRQLERTATGIRFSADLREQKAPAARYVINLPRRPVARGSRVAFTVRFGGVCGLLSGVAGVRLQDTAGETFHFFPSETIRLEDGTTCFRYDIEEKNAIHWGGDADGRFGAETPQLVAVTFSIDDGAAPSDAVDLIALETIAPESEGPLLSAEVETGNSLHLVRADGGTRPTLVLRSRANGPRTWRGTLRLIDFFDRGRDVPVEVEIPANGVARVDVGMVPRQGHWRVAGKLASGASTARVETAFAALSRPRDASADSAGGFRMGLNFHSFVGYDERARHTAEDALTALGVRLVRGSVGNFRQVEPQRGVWRWEKTDRIVSELTDRGIGIHAIVYSPPAWAIPEAMRNRMKGKTGAADAPPEREAYAEYLRRFAARYAGKIAYYEIGNEWDTLFFHGVMTAQEAIDLQKLAYAAIKSVDPAACVIHNGFCTADASGQAARRSAIETFLTGACGSYDRQTVHIHGTFDSYERQLDDFFFPDRQRLGLTKIPWYSDETAHTSGLATEACVAATVWKKILHAQAMGSVDYIWYNLRACGGIPSEEGYGLMTRDFVPRPSFCAFAALERLIGGLKAERPLVRTGYRRIYRLAGGVGRNRRIVLAGWDAEPTSSALTVRTDAAAAFAVDLMGNRTPLVRDGERVAWSPGRLPSAVLLEGASRAVIVP